MKNNTLNNSSKISSRQHQSSTTINVGNSEVLEIFGVNNINLDFFESNLPIKIYQKGNQLNLKGEKKYINILKNAILKTINQIKIKKRIIKLI